MQEAFAFYLYKWNKKQTLIELHNSRKIISTAEIAGVLCSF